MKMPRRGCMVDQTTGQVIWAWNLSEPDRDFEHPGPIVQDLNGVARAEFDPARHLIIDLETETEPEHLPLLYHKMADARLYQHPETKRWTFKNVAQIGGVAVEVDHPLEQVIQAKKFKTEAHSTAPPPGSRRREP